MGIEIKGDNNGIAVEGELKIEKLNIEWGKGIRSVKGVAVSEIEDAVVVEEIRPSWEEAVPEWLRTGKLLIAWNELRKVDILDDDYRLMNGGSKAEAHFLVTCFCQQKKKNTWKPFENFWGFTDLIHGKGAFSKEQEDVISEIFRNL